MRVEAGISIVILIALGGCAVAPEGPSEVAMPGPGKSFEAFRADDAACRQFGAEQSAVNAATAATQSLIATTALGTAFGAAEGALIGTAVGSPGAGTAIGAASGLGLGAAWGLAAAQHASTTVQARYDAAYAQCMQANGETLPQLASVYTPYPYGAFFYSPAAVPYPYYYSTWVRTPIHQGAVTGLP